MLLGVLRALWGPCTGLDADFPSIYAIYAIAGAERSGGYR